MGIVPSKCPFQACQMKEPLISVKDFCELKLVKIKPTFLHELINKFPPTQIRRYWLGRKKLVVASELYQDLKTVGFMEAKRS